MTLPPWLHAFLPDWLLAKIGEWSVPAWVQLMADSFWPLLHAGLVFTVPLTLMSFALGLALAFVVALIRLFGPAPLVAVVRFYVWLIRGTPLLVQLFVIFYGLPSVGIVLDPLPAALIGFTLNVGAYNSEVIRGAIESITKGQWEAAYSLSMTRGQALRRTILPQAARVAVPPLSNSFIALVKDTSLAAVLTVPEIFQAAQRIAAVTYEPLILYTEADWYGATFADTSLNDSQHLQVAAYVQSLDYKRIYGVSSQATTLLDSTVTSDIASSLLAAGYDRSLVMFSTFSPYAVAGLFGLAATVNWEGSNTAYTLMGKTVLGITGETMTSAQASTLKAKRVNSYAKYQNGTAIVQYGMMSARLFFDERHGMDWMENSMQSDAFDLIRVEPKVAQTDAGMTKIINTLKATAEQGITNGLLAPGTWNGASFGALRSGDALPAGYYFYCPPVAAQSQASRETRVTPPIQAALKFAGAVHQIDCAVTVNR